VDVVGYWATWPVEKVNGRMVAHRFFLAPSRPVLEKFLAAGNFCYPSQLCVRILPTLVLPQEAKRRDFLDLIPLSSEEFEMLKAFPAPQAGNPISALKFTYLTQVQIEQTSVRLLQGAFDPDAEPASVNRNLGQSKAQIPAPEAVNPPRHSQPDLFMVYLPAVDSIEHTFWEWYEPQAFAEVDSELIKEWGDMIPAIYRHTDRYLARLLPLLDAQTTLIIVSDHGMQANPRRNRQQHARSGEHHRKGIFIAWGKNIQPGKISGADILDITPTILRLLNLPVSATMPGHPLDEAFWPEFRESYPLRTISAYPFTRVPAPRNDAAGEDEMILNRLRFLGYIKK